MHPGGEQGELPIQHKTCLMSCYVRRNFVQYINLGSYVTVPAGVMLDNSLIVMQG